VHGRLRATLVLTASADFNHRLLIRLAALRSIMRAPSARPRDRRCGRDAGHHRLRIHPDTSSSWVRARSVGFRGRRSAPGIAGTGGIGQQMARWIADGDGSGPLMDIRRFRAGAGHCPDVRTTPPTTTSITPTRSGVPPGRCVSPRPTTRSPPSARSSARSRCGSVRTGSPRTRRGPASRIARPWRRSGRGWAGEHWSPAIGRRGARGRPPVSSTRSSFAKVDGRAPALLQHLCATTSTGRSGASPHADAQPRGGIECDFTVTRLAEDRFLIVTGTAPSATTTSAGSASTSPDGSVHVRDATPPAPASGWGPGRATSWRRSRRTTSRRGLRT
jgi:4-methylaminobutanoate oxidase (formaldehyde-forming)